MFARLYLYLNMKRLSLLFALISILPFGCSKDEEEPQVESEENTFINEVYPASGEDWIEIYNANTTEKDISGYKIYDDETNKYTLPQGTVIAANGFIVLICDDTGTGLHTNFKLTSAGETVYLTNKEGELVDKVAYVAVNDGESYGRYPDGSESFSVSGTATRGTSNGTSEAPIINTVTRSVTVPQLNQEVLVKAEVLSNSTLDEVKLFYRLEGDDFSSVAMTKNGSFYQGIIPGFSNTGRIEYYVSAKNSDGKIAVSPFDAPADAYHYLLNTDALPQLFINEFLAANTSCCPDNDGEVEEFDDWVEIYNAGDEPVDIGDMYLSDDETDPFKTHIADDDPTLTTIPPGGFLILWADEQGSQGPLHMNFKLTTDGESIGIFYKDGRTVDIHTFGLQQGNVSSGRTVDGGSTWTTFPTPTPGTSNN
jgi:hypothetical protein